jgi:hypothetical protein
MIALRAAVSTTRGFGTIGAVLSIGVSLVAKLGERATPAAFARRFVWLRYSPSFPKQPAQEPELSAYGAVRDGWTGNGEWGIRALRDRLYRIQQGLSVNQVTASDSQQAGVANGASSSGTASTPVGDDGGLDNPTV